MGEPSSRCKLRQIVFAGVCIVSVVSLVLVILHFTSTRKRLCTNTDEVFYITDKESGNGTCYPKGQQGPCGTRSVIVSDIRNFSLGICNCDFRNHNRSLVFHEETNQCYFIFDQGWCEPGEWVVVNNSAPYVPTCEKNYCRRSDSTSTRVPKGGNNQECVELGSPEGCSPGETMRFFPGKIYPACNYKHKPPPDTSTASFGPPPVNCQPGYYVGLDGRCVLQYNFDF